MNSKCYRLFNDMDEVSYKLRSYFNNCIGHDYDHQTLDQILADERRISELTVNFAHTLGMIIQGMRHQEWETFWESLGNYIYEEDD